MDSPHPFNEKELLVIFEEDLSTLFESQEFRSRSLFRFNEHQNDQPEIPDPPDPVLAETEIARSYLSAVFSTIQPINDHQSLLIMAVTSHPAPERRFSNATINWKFKPTTPPSDEKPLNTSPRVLALAPQYSVGGWTEEQVKLTWGVSVPVGVGLPVAAGGTGPSVSVDPSFSKEKQNPIMHAMTIIGTARDAGTRCVWTIEENKASARGIPLHLQLAVVLDHSGPFVAELDFKAELSGGLWPIFMQAKKGRHDYHRTIDIETWKTGEIKLEPGETGWRQFMAGVTGEVPGVMQEFKQVIARP